MEIKKIAIGADHAGFELKEYLKEYLTEKGYEVIDKGTNSEESVDYADYGHPVAKAVEDGKVDLGLLMCGSGNGINMTANKHQGIRSALCWDVHIAELAREHNNANVLTLPARFLSNSMAERIVNAFLGTEFEGGRHERRINKIPC